MAYNAGVRRAFSLALLVVSVLLAGTLQAQRTGVGGRGGAGFGGHSGFRQGHSGGRNLRSGRFYPFWDDGLFWDDQPYWDDQPPQDQQIAPQAMMMQPAQTRHVLQAVPVANPKVIELSGIANAASAKSLPSAIFVLENGERLETRQYLLTHENLYLTIDRHQRTIPLSKLNINATTAVNRERGIDLRIPVDRNEIYLGF